MTMRGGRDSQVVGSAESSSEIRKRRGSQALLPVAVRNVGCNRVGNVPEHDRCQGCQSTTQEPVGRASEEVGDDPPERPSSTRMWCTCKYHQSHVGGRTVVRIHRFGGRHRPRSERTLRVRMWPPTDGVRRRRRTGPSGSGVQRPQNEGERNEPRCLEDGGEPSSRENRECSLRTRAPKRNSRRESRHRRDRQRALQRRGLAQGRQRCRNGVRRYACVGVSYLASSGKSRVFLSPLSYHRSHVQGHRERLHTRARWIR